MDVPARRSGASQIIGTMLTFAMGVAILSGVILVFNLLQSNALKDIREPQSAEVLNYIAAASTNLVKQNASISYVIITIPSKIGDSAYIITGNENGDKIMLISPEISANVSSPAPFSGFFESSYETAKIRYEAGNLFMEGVSN